MSSKPWKYLRKIETIFTKKIRQLLNKGPRWTRFAIKRFRKSHDTVPLKEKNNTKKISFGSIFIRQTLKFAIALLFENSSVRRLKYAFASLTRKFNNSNTLYI